MWKGGREKDVHDVEEGDDGEGEEAPLVDGVHEGTDEAGYDGENTEEQDEKDFGCAHAGGEEDEEEEEREVDEPLDVANILRKMGEMR